MKLSTKLILLFLIIISLSLALLSWQGLKYFISDKETYVHDINAQNLVVLSNYLASRVKTIGEKLDGFAEFADYKFASAGAKLRAQQNLQKKYYNFLSIAAFDIRGGVNPRFAFYNDQGLKVAKVSQKDLSSRKFILDLYKKSASRKIGFVNFTRNTSLPIIIFYKRTSAKRIVVSTVPQNSLMNIVSSKSIYTAFVVDGKGNLLMDQNPLNLIAGKNISDHPMVKKIVADKDRRISGGTGEYLDAESKEEMLGSWAHVGNTGLGLIIQMPTRLAYMAAQELLRKLAIWIILIFAIAVLITLFFSSTITRPLKNLSKVASKVGDGDFNVELPKSKTKDELGDLVKAFDKMSSGLKDRDKKIEEANKQLVQSEKMGAFGQMSAGIAHEVKNPLAGILGYTQIAKKKAPPESGLDKYLVIIEKETKRCKDIVENLMKFARSEKAAFDDIDMVQVVKDSVALVDHQISITGIKIEKKFPSEEIKQMIKGNANQITQVLTNIMLNAQYAMKKKGDGGVLTVEVPAAENGKAKIILQDTGTGIKKENIPKLFDPFFTTKPSGEGTGLGLSVTYGIIRDHKGEINVESELGEWTRFIISLPLKV